VTKKDRPFALRERKGQLDAGGESSRKGEFHYIQKKKENLSTKKSNRRAEGAGKLHFKRQILLREEEAIICSKEQKPVAQKGKGRLRRLPGRKRRKVQKGRARLAGGRGGFARLKRGRGSHPPNKAKGIEDPRFAERVREEDCS